MRYLLLFLPFIFFGCIESIEDDSPPVNALVPIYSSYETGDIVNDSIRSYLELSNFVIYQDLIFLVDKGIGVHVIDNSDEASLYQIAYFELPGAISIVVKDDYLIVSVSTQLLSINISDIDMATITSIVELVGSTDGTGFFPEEYNGAFQCVDPSLGIVIGWESAQIFDPKCFR